jgi:hypothetical protein
MLKLNRREVGIAFALAAGLALDDKAFADDDTGGDTGGGGGGGGDTSGETGDNTEPPPNDDTGPDSTNLTDTDDPLGLSCRAPTLSGDSMTMLQMLGTGTTEPSSFIGVEPGNYASDEVTSGLQDDSKSFIDSAIEKLDEASSYIANEIRTDYDEVVKELVSLGLTVSTGPEVKADVGVAEVFALAQQDNKGNTSETVGAGGNLEGVEVGGFITHEDQSNTYSVGVFAEKSDVAVMVSAGVPNGYLVVDVGVIVGTGAQVGVEDTIEVSKEFEVGQAVVETFRQMFGGLADYRNFQDPLLYPP